MAHFVLSVIILFSLYHLIHCDPTSTIQAFIESNGLTSTIKSSVTDDNLKTLRWPVKYTYVDPVNDNSFEVVVVFWHEISHGGAEKWVGVIPPKVFLTNGPSSGPNITELRRAGSKKIVRNRNGEDVSCIVIQKEGTGLPWFADLAWLSGSDKVAITPWGYGTGGVKVALRLATDFVQKCGVDVAKIHDAAMFPCASKTIFGAPKKILVEKEMQFARVFRLFQGKTDCSLYESGGFKYDWSYLPSDERTPIQKNYNDFMTKIKAMTVSTALASITGTGRVNFVRKQQIKLALKGTKQSKLGQALVKLYTPGSKVGAGCVKYHDIMDKLVRAVLDIAPDDLVIKFGCSPAMMAKESKNIAELIHCWLKITTGLELTGIQSIPTTKSDRKTWYETTVPAAFGYSAMRIVYNQYNGYYSKRSRSHSQNRIKQKRSHSQNIYNYDYQSKSIPVPVHSVNNDYQSYDDYNSMQSVMVVIVTLICLIIMLVICCLCVVGGGFVFGMYFSSKTDKSKEYASINVDDNI